MQRIFAELKRRNVTRAAVLYLGAAWVLAQGTAALAPELGMPSWTTRAFVIAVAIGFPFWVAMAWLYEWTPEGLRRETEVPEEESITGQTGRRLNYWIVGVLSLAVVLLLTDKLLLRKPAAEVVAGAVAAEPAIPSASIAVLPLVNDSGDGSQAFFADGLTEELIGGLSRIRELKVIGRSSSARFRDSDLSSASIGEQLGVAHLLEGSVRRQGDQVRVRVNLVMAEDGRSLWSQVFERELSDIFRVQDEIAQAVAAALQVQLGNSAWLLDEWPSNGDVEAYLLYLEGRAMHRSARESDLAPTIDLLHKAIERDPGYAAAHALLAVSESNRAALTFDDQEARDRYASASLAALDQALGLAPDSPPVMMVHSHLSSALRNDPAQAAAIAARAFALHPDHPLAMNAMKRSLSAQGRFEEMLEVSQRLLEIDPLRGHFLYEHAQGLGMLGRYDESAQMLRRVVAVEPDMVGVHGTLSMVELLRGQPDEAMAEAAREVFPLLRLISRATVEAALGDRDRAMQSVAEMDAACGDRCAGFHPGIYALLGEREAMYDSMERAIAGGGMAMLVDPLLRPLWDEPRFRELAARNGTPVPGDAASPSPIKLPGPPALAPP